MRQNGSFIKIRFIEIIVGDEKCFIFHEKWGFGCKWPKNNEGYLENFGPQFLNDVFSM